MDRSRKRKFDIDKHSTIARPVPAPPRPLFYTETTHTFQQRDANAPMTGTSARHRVPISPHQRPLRSNSPSESDASDVSMRPDSPAHPEHDAGSLTDSSCMPALADASDEGSEGELGEESDGDDDEEEEKKPRAQRQSVHCSQSLIPFSNTSPGLSVLTVDSSRALIRRRTTTT